MSSSLTASVSNKPAERAFELDFLRGLSIVMMMLHHVIFDIRYIFGIDAFAWQESSFFQSILRPPFVFTFLFVSGVCCTFSRSNYKRSARLGGVALLFSVVFFVVSRVSDTEMYIVSNVILVLAAGTLIYAILGSAEKRSSSFKMEIWLIAAILVVVLADFILVRTDPITAPWLTLFHRNFEAGFGMADHMPLIPWLWMFFAGALTGRLFYSSHKSFFPGTRKSILKALSPFIFIGRNSMLFYLLHQPVILLMLYLIRLAGLI